MAKLIDSYSRLVPTWVAAAQHLIQRSGEGRTQRNLVLEIVDPLTITVDDRRIIMAVDDELRRNQTSIETVAGTIFPQGMFSRFGRPEFYDRYVKAMRVGKKPNTWGTYALRLIERKTGVANETINPLDIIVERLRRAKVAGNPFKSAYEAGIIDTTTDFNDGSNELAEIPTYDPVRDANRNRNMPCLSHLSFKLNDRTSVDLTAVYRYQYYGQRALGNLIGLGRLLKFVADEATLSVGSLTCIATHAFFDADALGGISRARQILTDGQA